MKMCIKNPFLLAVLMAGLGLPLAGRVTAQTFTTLYNFDGGSDGSSEDPVSLILAGSTMFGTTTCCSSFLDPRNNGTVFAVNTDATGFSTLYEFTGGFDGGVSFGDLILSGTTLYGTANYGGSSGNGAVFAINTNGTGFAVLYSFTSGFGQSPNVTNSDGAYPHAGLVLSGNTLYGTAGGGGASGKGTVFAVKTDGTGFTNLYSFSATHNNSSGILTNSDGAYPGGNGFSHNNLVLSGRTLYGTAGGGGASGKGTVFAVKTDGTGFTNLHSFTGGDGAVPNGLILSGNTLYGTAYGGGSSDSGTVFKISADGTGFTTLHTFTGTGGAKPVARLVLSGNTLFGTTYSGGIVDAGTVPGGTVFKVNTDGTGFVTLYNFTGTGGSPPYINNDGSHPTAGVILSGDILYGATATGGSSGLGAVFAIALPVNPPQLNISSGGGNVVLTWPTNATGFTLQSGTNLVWPVTWTAVSPGPVVVGGQNVVTNAVSGGAQFFRLGE